MSAEKINAAARAWVQAELATERASGEASQAEWEASAAARTAAQVAFYAVVNQTIEGAK